jgi:hypothetical protein
MALLVHCDGETTRWPLAGTTLVGRHWSCGVVIPAPRAPAFWLELRWGDDGWLWRELAGGGHTRGSGAEREGGWRPLLRRPVRWDGALAVTLDDLGPPREALHDLEGGAAIDGPALDELLETADGARWVPVEEGAPTRRLSDGDVCVLEGRAFRYLAGVGAAPTLRDLFHVGHPGVALELDLEARRAFFRCASRDVLVSGECVRVLAAYAAARLEGDGWLTREEAHDRWRALGGRATSGAARLGWERGKLRSQLAQQGVMGVRELFEARLVDGVHEARLAIAPRQIGGLR